MHEASNTPVEFKHHSVSYINQSLYGKSGLCKYLCRCGSGQVDVSFLDLNEDKVYDAVVMSTLDILMGVTKVWWIFDYGLQRKRSCRKVFFFHFQTGQPSLQLTGIQ